MDDIKRAIQDDPEAVLQIVKEMNANTPQRKTNRQKKKITSFISVDTQQAPQQVAPPVAPPIPQPIPQPIAPPVQQSAISNEFFEKLFKKIEDMETKMTSKPSKVKKAPKPKAPEPAQEEEEEEEEEEAPKPKPKKKAKAKKKKEKKEKVEEEPKKPKIGYKRVPHGRGATDEAQVVEAPQETIVEQSSAPAFKSIFADDYY